MTGLRRRTGLLVIGIVALLGAGARPAHAQDSTATTEQARNEFRAGTQAFAADDFAGALDHYRRAFELAPHDAVRFNVAVCLERLGRFREAAIEYRLATESAELDEAAKERGRVQLALMRERLGTLTVDGEPGGATVEVDGVPLCVLPCSEEIDPGEHSVRVHTADGREATTRVRVARGQIESVVLTPPPRLLEPSEPTDGVGLPRPNAVVDEDADGGPGWLTVIGTALTIIGAGGAVGFGFHTTSLHDAYIRMPNSATRDEGLIMTGLFHASLGVAALGGVLALLDLLLSGDEGHSTAQRTSSDVTLDVRSLSLRF